MAVGPLNLCPRYLLSANPVKDPHVPLQDLSLSKVFKPFQGSARALSCQRQNQQCLLNWLFGKRQHDFPSR